MITAGGLVCWEIRNEKPEILASCKVSGEDKPAIDLFAKWVNRYSIIIFSKFANNEIKLDQRDYS